MKHGLSLKECYAMLGIPEGSNLEEVKRAYRKRAFELHPDLNPDDGASRQFQLLNEAYVILIRLLDMHKEAPRQEEVRQGTEPGATSAKAGQDAYREQARKNREREEKERRERQEAERRAKERQEQEEKQQREKARRERLREEIERQEAERLARKEKAREERERLAKARLDAEREREEILRREAEPKTEAYRRSYAKSGQRPGGDAQKNGASVQTAYATTFGNAGSHAYAEPDEPARQAMLNDLLNDPFARRVYEDIYSEIQNRKSAPLEPEKVTPSQPPPREARNIGEAIRGWARGQLDQTQELFFPAQSLYPGAKFRLKVRPGLSGEPRTIEVTLPQDFVVGKPVRLKGMGKKVGKWQGDLYLTFQIKP